MVSASEAKHTIRKGGSAALATTLLLIFSHLLIMFCIIGSATMMPTLIVSLISLTLSLIITYHLYLLEKALDRVARGAVVHLSTLRRHWPLTHLFVLVEAIVKQAGQQVQMEQRNVEYRDQLLQQVSKTAAQEERNRLARDLHDSIKQQIFSIVVSAAAVKVRWEQQATSARKIVDDIERTALEAQIEMQAMLQQLRPVALENVGLIESLRMQCQALGYRTGAEVEAELSELPPEDLLPLGAQETIFRIVQEGFANIARHARAQRVWLSLYRQRDTLLVEIGDNGQGFDLAGQGTKPGKDGGMGLCNIRERVKALGGTVSIWSRLDEGTTLHLAIPLSRSPLQLEAEEQERVSREITTARRKGERALRIGTRFVEVGAVLFILNLPLPLSIIPTAIFFCGLFAFIAWFWSQQHRLQVSFELGPEHEQSNYLRGLSYGLLTGIFILALLFPFTTGTVNLDTRVFSRTLGELLLFWDVIIGAALIATFVLYNRNMRRYYMLQTPGEQAVIVHQLLRQMIIDWLAWFGTVILTIILVHDVSYYPFHIIKIDNLPNFYASYYNPSGIVIVVCILIFWFIINFAKWRRLVRWQRIRTQVKG